MSRTQIINETLAILGKVLPEQGFPDLDNDKLQEIYIAIESYDKKQKDIIAQELGFSIRKRSVSKKDKLPDDPDKKPRKTGYACFPGDDDSPYKARIDELFGSSDSDGKTITKAKAKAAVWKTLSEAEKEPFNQKASEINRENGIEEKKKTPSPKEPKPTNSQLAEQNRALMERLQQHGVTDIPELPPREVKPRKKKDSNPPSPVEEQPVLSPPVQIPQSAQEGDDSDSDDEEQPDHTQWAITLVKNSDETGSKADFIAWLISNNHLEFGPSKRNTIYNDDEIKELKKTHDFKAKKKDPTSPWYDFIKTHSDE